MFGFGNDKKKKEEEEKEKAQQEQVAKAMKAMSDQIASQAQVIKQLQDQLTAAKADDATSAAAAKTLATAQAQLKQMHDQMEKMKAEEAAEEAREKAEAAASAKAAAAAAAVGAAAAAPAAAPASAKAAAATGGLSAGATAYVQKAGGKSLRLRSAAGLDSTILDGLAPGTQMTLLSGPADKDGYPWWHIRTADGREGWVAGTELVTHPE